MPLRPSSTPPVVAVLLVAACASRDASGPSLMVGVLVDAGGRPVVGLEVQSLEEPATTDAEGRFAVSYKAPSQYVHFTWHGLWYRRFYQPSDEGSVVRLALPPTRAAQLSCGQLACDATLTWDLGEGLVATTSRACRAGATAELPAIPAGAPDVTCELHGERQEVSLDATGDVLTLGPPRRLVRAELRVVEGQPPDDCHVVMGDRVAQRVDDGGWIWAAEVSGAVQVHAACDGRPARPVPIEADESSGTFDWTPTGPWVDLEERAAWASTLTLVSETGEQAGWSLALQPGEDGRFALPPLVPGTYRFLVEGADEGLALAATPPQPREPGVLALARVPDAEAMVGRLVLTADMLGGTLALQ